MDFYIHGIPRQTTNSQFNAFLAPYLNDLGIRKYECHKPKAKGCAYLFIHDHIQGQVFHNAFSNREDIKLHPKISLVVKLNSWQDRGASLRDAKFKDERVPIDSLENSMAATSIGPQPIFRTTSLSCGIWEYQGSEPVFVSYYTDPRSFAGELYIGRTSAVLLLFSATSTNQWTKRVDFAWHSINTIFATGGASPNLIFTCRYSPKLYRPESGTLSSMLKPNTQKRTRKNVRISSLDDRHGEVAATSLSYQISFARGNDLETVLTLLSKRPEIPPIMRIRTQTGRPERPFIDEMRELIATFGDLKEKLPFVVRFQVMKLVMNGTLPPSTIIKLLPKLIVLVKDGKLATSCAHALYKLYNRLPSRGPHSQAEEFQLDVLEGQLQSDMSNHNLEGSVFRTVKKHDHLALIHHVRVTPTGIYLEGPEQEVSNRVLRKYKDNLESFVRVTFSDEDGEKLEFHWNTVLDELYFRIQNILDGGISICGDKYSFLGFSSSSLKSQTAWFMAPFFDRKTKQLTLADLVILNLGDFSHFRSPAKCAARIGQAFSDTEGFVTCHAEATIKLDDVKRNGRVFSDGCGTISPNLATKVVAQYSRLQMKTKPVAFQIRYQGVKGVLSVDPSMQGEEIGIRPSMWKFQSRDTNDLEICSMADRPLSLYLNRPLINVLEDLGVPEEGVLEMATNAVNELQRIISSPINAANFLEAERVGESAGFPSLIRRMDDVKINVAEDPMLLSVVRMCAYVRLRDIKYKGRIFVEKGIKLMGIMDETGFLEEGEIHCLWVTPEGNLKRLVGRVTITRSPTNHPGDVQVVRAVNAPTGSPLNQMYNCVVFSQHGERDLPSMLGGGDLDGDMYDIFWDSRLTPRSRFEPADYPILPAINIGRQIMTQDITRHFVDHMKNDNVGMLSTLLLSLSDRRAEGTRDPDCIKIAGLISTALDFPKTGIKADVSTVSRCKIPMKPDFMAPGPSVKVGTLANLIEFESFKQDPHDPVSQLDPEQRPTKYYKSDKLLGKLYRLVDEKAFYETLQTQARAKESIHSEAMNELWTYIQKAAAGVQFDHLLNTARIIRDTYEYNLNDTRHWYALHPSYPLHEVEVVSGCILGSTQVRRLKAMVSDMHEKYRGDVTYTRTCIREGDNGDDGEALARSLACVSIAMDEPGMKVGKEGALKSFAYVAAAVCLEELERFHGGLLRRV